MSIFRTLQNLIQSKNTENTNTNADIISEIISAVKTNDRNKAVKLLASNSTSKPMAIPYTKDAVLTDMDLIQQFKIMASPTDQELTAAILSTMLHKTHQSTLKILKDYNCGDITSEKLTYISTYIVSLRSLKDFQKAGIKKFKVASCGDERVCPACKKQNGKVHMVEKASIGKNAPPFCSKCRCIMRPIFK